MKLIHCQACGDVVRLHPVERSCLCGRSGGRYLDDSHATFHGPAVPIGIITRSLLVAIQNQTDSGQRSAIEAFVFDRDSDSFRRSQAGT